MNLEPASQVIRDLATRLRRGGKDADEAALAIGLLLEREKVSGASSDALLLTLFGPDLARERLTPVAVYEAVNALLEHMRDQEVPTAGVIWALVKSFDPRIVPHLTEVLERIVADPDHVATAHQIVQGLVCFSVDPRALAGIRLAASRGVGEAKETAQQWLGLHGHVDAHPGRDRRVHVPASTCAIEGPVYRLQRRPGHREVIVNDGDRGVRAIDPFTGRTTGRSSFSARYASDGVIHAWCLRSDGWEMAAFSSQGSGSLISFETGRAVDLAPPDPGGLDNLRYLWEADTLLLASGKVSTFWRLHRQYEIGGAPIFESARAIDVRRRARAWMEVNGSLSPLESRVLRTEPDAARVLAYDHARPPGELVALSWREGGGIRVPAPGFVPELACDGQRFFLLYDHEVVAIDERGTVTDGFPAPPGTYLRGLDVLPAAPDGPATLVVAAASLADRRLSRLLVYPLASETPSSA